MGSVQNSSSSNGWLLDYGICDDVSASDFIWAPQIIDDPMLNGNFFMDFSPLIFRAMIGFDVPCKEDGGSDNTCPKKRKCVESGAPLGTKACREKLRRDKLNDRFMELCSILDPGRPPKADKVAILSDAVRRLNQIRLEAQNLKESNEALRDTIKSLKEEKLELRDEKTRLKAEKERIEQILKVMTAAPTFIPHYASASTSFHAACKSMPYPNYMPVGMWQWLPPAAVDTSQDHVLRPPVA